jgi:hypothetical protein
MLQKRSTLCTLPETELIQIVYLFFHVFCDSLVLLSTDLTYSRIPGDQGGPIFFRLKDIFCGHFTNKLVQYNVYLGYKFVSDRV